MRSRAFLLFVVSLLLAILACARSDVPAPTEFATVTADPPEILATEAVPAATITSAATLPPSETPWPSVPEPVVSPTIPPTPTAAGSSAGGSILYKAQSGDTLRSVAVHFAVVPSDISSAGAPLPGETDMLVPGQILVLPRRLADTSPPDELIPDSEMVFSPPASAFDPVAFATDYPGFLNEYKEVVGGQWRSGPEVVAMAALDNSVSPRLLLALLEYQSGWLTNPKRPDGDAFNYPMGRIDSQIPGLYRQLTWLANELGNGYYGWRAGTLTDLRFKDGSTLRIAPELNAGTVGLQWYFAQQLSRDAWEQAIGPDGFLATYRSLFGDPMAYESPLFEPGIKQPEMILPFLPGHIWAFTGGPHGAWEREAAWAALDFAPSTTETGCKTSEDWAVAVAPGLIVRSGNGVVVLDLDGDGNEQTGWDLLYLHIAAVGRIQAGKHVETGDLIGHPSCEGGIATGTHVHLARKYNGEWILADGPLPFELSGWIAHAGTVAYQGLLTKDGATVVACPCASRETYISR
jgi:LasA protease